MSYSTPDLMIIAAAREIKDKEVAFVGMRLPMIAYSLARLTHAPDAVGLFECGIMRYTPAKGKLYTMSDPANQKGAAWLTGTIQLMGLLQGGHVDVGFIGGAQLDRYGNINSSYIGDFENPEIKLPGSGGAADIAAMAGRLVTMMKHEKHRFVEQVDYITSTGYLSGGKARELSGLEQGGTAAVISDLCVLRPYGPLNELHLASWHSGVTIKRIREATGWDLKLMPEACETPEPTRDELEAFERLNKVGF